MNGQKNKGGEKMKTSFYINKLAPAQGPLSYAAD
jgi:hypothetical protein